MSGVLLYHAASARVPYGRLRCRNTRCSDRTALSIPPRTAHMANHGGKRPCRAALHRFHLSLLSIGCARGARQSKLALYGGAQWRMPGSRTRRLVAALGQPWLCSTEACRNIHRAAPGARSLQDAMTMTAKTRLKDTLEQLGRDGYGVYAYSEVRTSTWRITHAPPRHS